MSTLTAVPVENSQLTENQLRRLKSKLMGKDMPIVDANTTPHEAGFRLGVQFVLHFLREGWGDRPQPER